jgi:hypothetical protein
MSKGGADEFGGRFAPAEDAASLAVSPMRPIFSASRLIARRSSFSKGSE